MIRLSNKIKPIIAYPIGLIGVLGFALTLPLTEIVLTDFSPITITVFRAIIATIASLIVITLFFPTIPKRTEAKPLLISGIALIYGFPLAMAQGLQTVPSYHGAVVLGVLPLLTAVFAKIIHGEATSRAFWGWSIVGAGIVITFALQEHEGKLRSGDFWLMLAACFASYGYVTAGELSKEKGGPWVISWSLVVVFPISFMLLCLFWPNFFWERSIIVLNALGALGLISMYFAFFAWNTALAWGGIAQIGQIQLFQPFMTLGWGYLLLNEAIDLNVLVFTAAVVASVYLGRTNNSVKLIAKPNQQADKVRSP